VVQPSVTKRKQCVEIGTFNVVLWVGNTCRLAGNRAAKPNILAVKENKQMTDKKPITTIDEYIRTFPVDSQVILEKVRQAIQKAAPDAVETMSYNMPTFDLNGKHLVFFAGWKHHISLYPIPAGDEGFQQQISHYKRVKSTLQFPLDKPIPYDLVEKIVTLLIMEKPEKER
jgi:uncharacterized protein YdhG (YjbR/CyaY superfamily)